MPSGRRITALFYEIRASVDGLSADLQGAERQFGKLSSFIQANPTASALALGAALAGVAVTATKMAIDVETAARKVDLALKLTAGQAAEMREQIRGFSVEFGRSQTEIAGVMKTIADNGPQSAAGLRVMTKAALELARLTGDDPHSIARGLDGVLDAFGRVGEEAETVAASLYAITRGRVPLQDLFDTLDKVAASAHASGLSIEDVTGAVASLRDANVPARQVKTTIEELAAAGKEGAAEIRRLAGGARDAAKDSREFADALKDAKGRADELAKTAKAELSNALIALGNLALPTVNAGLREFNTILAQIEAHKLDDVARSLGELLSRIPGLDASTRGGLREGGKAIGAAIDAFQFAYPSGAAPTTAGQPIEALLTPRPGAGAGSTAANTDAIAKRVAEIAAATKELGTVSKEHVRAFVAELKELQKADLGGGMLGKDIITLTQHLQGDLATRALHEQKRALDETAAAVKRYDAELRRLAEAEEREKASARRTAAERLSDPAIDKLLHEQLVILGNARRAFIDAINEGAATAAGAVSPEFIASLKKTLQELKDGPLGEQLAESVESAVADGVLRGLQDGIVGGRDFWLTFARLGDSILSAALQHALEGFGKTGAGKALGGGAAAGVAGYDVGYAVGGKSAGLGALAGAGAGAATGALVGSAVPVIGTALGAVVGGAIGAIGGLIGAHNRAKDAAQKMAAAQEALAERQSNAEANRLGVIGETTNELNDRELRAEGLDKEADAIQRTTKEEAQYYKLLDAGVPPETLAKLREVQALEHEHAAALEAQAAATQAAEAAAAAAAAKFDALAAALGDLDQSGELLGTNGIEVLQQKVNKIALAFPEIAGQLSHLFDGIDLKSPEGLATFKQRLRDAYLEVTKNGEAMTDADRKLASFLLSILSDGEQIFNSFAKMADGGAAAIGAIVDKAVEMWQKARDDLSQLSQDATRLGLSGEDAARSEGAVFNDSGRTFESYNSGARVVDTIGQYDFANPEQRKTAIAKARDVYRNASGKDKEFVGQYLDFLLSIPDTVGAPAQPTAASAGGGGGAASGFAGTTTSTSLGGASEHTIALVGDVMRSIYAVERDQLDELQLIRDALTQAPRTPLYPPNAPLAGLAGAFGGGGPVEITVTVQILGPITIGTGVPADAAGAYVQGFGAGAGQAVGGRVAAALGVTYRQRQLAKGNTTVTGSA